MERDEKIIKMYSDGVSGTIISKELKIGRRTVYRVLEKNNIPLHSETKTKKNVYLVIKNVKRHYVVCVILV